jgi:hypothetical protein
VLTNPKIRSKQNPKAVNFGFGTLAVGNVEAGHWMMTADGPFAVRLALLHHK